MRSSWNQFFDSSGSTFSGGEITNPGQYHVDNCNFHDSSSRSIGFANSNLDTNRLLVEYSSFTNVVSSGYGGAINFNSKGECCMNRLCGIECDATGQGCFVNSYVSDKEKSKNYCNYSTISSKRILKGTQNFNLFYGEGLTSNVNLTNIKCYKPGITYYRPYNPFSIYSTVKNCTGKYVVLYESCRSEGKLISCNIDQNNGPNVVTLYNSPTLIVEECIIIKNKTPPLFYVYNSQTMNIAHMGM